MFKIKIKPKCFGGYIWESKSGNCKYERKCIDMTNQFHAGTRIKYTNRHSPPPTPPQPNK